MRRAASGSGVWGAGTVSSRGVGRLVFGVMVGDEGDDLVRAQFLAAAQVGELYEEGHAGDRSSGVLDELAHGAGRTACGEQVDCDQDAGAFGDGVGVGFEGVGTVLEVVGCGDDLAGEFLRLAGEDEALFGAVGEGRAEHEAASFGRENAVVGDAIGSLGEGVHGRVQGAAVLYKGRYVLEGDARPREVGDGADVVLQNSCGVRGLARGTRHGAKVSITFAIISSLMRESTVARCRALFMASPTRPSSPLRSSGLRTCLNRAASRSTAAMMPRRWRG